jgi:hypothetical protein
VSAPSVEQGPGYLFRLAGWRERSESLGDELDLNSGELSRKTALELLTRADATGASQTCLSKSVDLARGAFLSPD